MRASEFITEKWSAKYKRSINCNNPKGFSQKAHCAGRKKNESVAEGTNNITYKQQKGNNKFSVEMLVDGKPAGMFQYDANTGRTITELDPAYRGQGLGQRLILKGIYTAAMLGMDYVEDESRTAMFDRALDSLADAGYIVNDEEYWYVTDTGEQFLKQGVTESTEEIPQEIYNLLDELTADDTGSEDFGNYVLRFEGFTDWCQQDAAERCELPDNDPRKLKYYEDVYDEVLQGWIREQGAQPVDKGFAGDEDYPVQWAVFKKQGVTEGVEHNQQDLDDVADWLNTTPDNLSVEVKQEPIEKFIKQIREMYGTYDEFPEDEERTSRILKLLKRGAKPLPIYVEANDPDLFVMEGRHRMVAFCLAGMKTIPVAYASKNINENFADGKVKGKSRPGRVKRAGASCEGSVTELRAKAKKYSGEKAKMYHWCANMKGGKKK